LDILPPTPQLCLSVVSKGPCLFLKAQFQTYAVFSYLSHNNATFGHKPYNDENNAWLTSSNQYSIVATVVYVLSHATGAGL